MRLVLKSMGLVDSGAVLGDALAHQRLTHPIGKSGASPVGVYYAAHPRLMLVVTFDPGPFERCKFKIDDAALTHSADSIQGSPYS